MKNNDINILINELNDKKGENILYVDTEGTMHPVADSIIIVSALNEIHIKGLMEAMLRFYKKNKDKTLKHLELYGVCGQPESHWVILDFNNLLIHIMTKETREEYSFDELFKNYETYRYHQSD